MIENLKPTVVFHAIKMLILKRRVQHHFVNISTKKSPRNKIKGSFRISTERAVGKTIKLLLYLLRKPRNQPNKSVYSIVGHPVV